MLIKSFKTLPGVWVQQFLPSATPNFAHMRYRLHHAVVDRDELLYSELLDARHTPKLFSTMSESDFNFEHSANSINSSSGDDPSTSNECHFLRDPKH